MLRQQDTPHDILPGSISRRPHPSKPTSGSGERCELPQWVWEKPDCQMHLIVFRVTSFPTIYCFQSCSSLCIC